MSQQVVAALASACVALSGAVKAATDELAKPAPAPAPVDADAIGSNVAAQLADIAGTVSSAAEQLTEAVAARQAATSPQEPAGATNAAGVDAGAVVGTIGAQDGSTATDGASSEPAPAADSAGEPITFAAHVQ